MFPQVIPKDLLANPPFHYSLPFSLSLQPAKLTYCQTLSVNTTFITSNFPQCAKWRETRE